MHIAKGKQRSTLGVVNLCPTFLSCRVRRVSHCCVWDWQMLHGEQTIYLSQGLRPIAAEQAGCTHSSNAPHQDEHAQLATNALPRSLV